MDKEKREPVAFTARPDAILEGVAQLRTFRLECPQGNHHFKQGKQPFDHMLYCRDCGTIEPFQVPLD